MIRSSDSEFPTGSLGRWDLLPLLRGRLAERFAGKRPHLLLACSGGPDSMALWDLLERWRRQTGAFLTVAHVNHRLRGKASDADRRFVSRRAARRGTPFLTATADTRAWARRRGRGLEEAARALRYAFLARLARRVRCGVVLTAHTLDDQVETFFLNLLRGAGPRGLAAMAEESPWPVKSARPLRLIRPLLAVRRDVLRAYLRRRGVPFRVDATNRSPAFLRNRLRPVLRSWERLRPGFLERVGQTCRILRDEETFWRAQLDRLLPPGTDGRRKTVLDAGRFIRYHGSVQRRILARLLPGADFDRLERTRALFVDKRARRGSLILPGGWVEKRGERLFIHPAARPRSSVRRPPRTHAASVVRRVPVPGRLRLRLGPSGQSRRWTIDARFVSRLPKNWRRARRRVFVDADQLDPPSLRARAWRPGDRFRPLGLAGRKKLQDFFVDERVAPAERRRIPLLVNRRGIVWVAGRRLSEAVKLTPATRRIVELRASVLPSPVG